MDEPDDPADKGNPPRRYKSGNVGPHGEYLVGKGRPPKHGQFATGDGRRRGRRPRGQKNFDTEFQEEARRSVTLRENGKERRVTKLRSAIVRAFDNAGAKGQNPAIANIFHHGARLADKLAPSSQGLSADEDAMIDAWLAQRLALTAGGDEPGDPAGPHPGVADCVLPEGGDERSNE